MSMLSCAHLDPNQLLQFHQHLCPDWCRHVGALMRLPPFSCIKPRNMGRTLLSWTCLVRCVLFPPQACPIGDTHCWEHRVKLKRCSRLHLPPGPFGISAQVSTMTKNVSQLEFPCVDFAILDPRLHTPVICLCDFFRYGYTVGRYGP